MQLMYTTFFDASFIVSGIAAITFFLYALRNYRGAKSPKNASGDKISRVVSIVPAPAQGSSRQLRPLSFFVQFVSAQIDILHLSMRKNRPSSVNLEADADTEYEMADTALAMQPDVIALGRLGMVFMWTLAFTLAMVMLFRTLITHHAPWVNMYEATIALACFLTIVYLIFAIRYHTNALGVFVATASFLLLLYAQWVGVAYNQAQPLEFGQITPALQDNPILALHVSMMIISYAFLMVSFGCALIMLAQGDSGAVRYSWLPSFEAADDLGYRAVIVGFPLLAIGIILGAYWANYAWGHYWSWDPKETSALITWLVYAVYLHLRGIYSIRGRFIAWVLVAGFVATLFTYIGVSFLVPGLHSYGGV